MTVSLALGPLFLVGGLWALALAIKARAKRRALLRNSLQVSGKIIRLEDTTSEGDSVTTSAPVVEYKVGDRKYELVLSPRQKTDDCPVGKKVVVFYEQGNPTNSIHELRMWDVNLACVLCLLPILIGVGFFYTAYQEASQTQDLVKTEASKPS